MSQQKNIRRNKKPKARRSNTTAMMRSRGPDHLRVRSLCAPDTITVPLRYTDPTISTLNAGGAQFALYTYRLNDVYDPDPALGSASTSGFNEWSALYTRYRVLKTTVNWTFTNQTSNILHAFMYANATGTVPTTVQAAISFTEVKHATRPKPVPPIPTTACVFRTTRTFSMPELYGNLQEYYANETCSGLCAPSPASPATKLYLTLVIYSGSVWNAPIDNQITLTFLTQFFGRFPVIN